MAKKQKKLHKGTFLNLVTKDDLAAVQAQIDAINATLAQLNAGFAKNNLVARVAQIEKILIGIGAAGPNPPQAKK